MCIIFYSHPPSTSQYALILAANRDEYLERPALPAHWHSFAPLSLPPSSGDYLCGRDLGDPAGSGGTWLGMSRAGHIGVLLNIHDDYPIRAPLNPDGSVGMVRSRGELIKEWLKAPEGRGENGYLKRLEEEGGEFAGFNLLLFEVRPPAGGGEVGVEGMYISNRTTPASHIHHLSPQQMELGGLSNSVLENPFPKVIEGKTLFRPIIDTLPSAEDDEGLIESLMSLLHTQSHPVNSSTDLPLSISIPLLDPSPRSSASYELTNPTYLHSKPLSTPGATPMPPTTPGATTLVSTPAPLEVKKARKPGRYGTRLSTVILVKRNGEVTFVERDRLRVTDSGEVVEGGRADRVERFVVGR